jgi:uncharacterized protein (TIGR03086 family)
MTDIRSFDRRAVETTTAIVHQVDAGMLELPTPCAGWDLRRLLAHMIGQNYGFAAAARGETKDRAVWADRAVGEDAGGEFAASAAEVIAAFGEPDVLERSFWLPEVRGGVTLPATTAVGFHFVDYVVHGWDVAAAIGIPVAFDADLLQAVLPIAQAVPDGEDRLRADSAFAPGVAAGAAPSALDRVLALLGRSPRWPQG